MDNTIDVNIIIFVVILGILVGFILFSLHVYSKKRKLLFDYNSLKELFIESQNDLRSKYSAEINSIIFELNETTILEFEKINLFFGKNISDLKNILNILKFIKSQSYCISHPELYESEFGKKVSNEARDRLIKLIKDKFMDYDCKRTLCEIVDSIK